MGSSSVAKLAGAVDYVTVYSTGDASITFKHEQKWCGDTFFRNRIVKRSRIKAFFLRNYWKVGRKLLLLIKLLK